MAALNEQNWKLAQQAEKELQATLADKDSLYQTIDRLITQYRSKCENLLLQEFEFALSKDVETRLWNAHGKINNRFRKHLGSFRAAKGKKKLVEHRKLIKHYLDFIKSSQRFYRGYIQRLDSHFDGIPELRAVARKLNLDALSADSQVQISGRLGHAVLISCHQTLVRLGDLSRYRESELAGKEYNWGPAIGYYVLAGTIYPASGTSHNQLAVIARTDVNHLRATYHLYRALAVEEPHPAAKGNLEIEFKKIRDAWSKGELISNGSHRESQGPGKAWVTWFMRLHARCYGGVDFMEHDELENEVLSQLAVDLKERSLEGTLNKFVLINIAAEYFAGIRLGEAPESQEVRQSCFFFQRLNVKTFFTLLLVLQPELERFAGGEEDGSRPEISSTNGSDKITAVARRILPSLRHYSSWLVSSAASLVAQVGDNSLNVQIKELWKIYANTLTLLTSTFPITALQSIDYLLEEDVDTLGFKPFENESTRRRYYDQDSTYKKPKGHDQGVERHHPNVEMLGRIRDLLTDGLEMHSDENIPIKIVDGTTTFAYYEEGLSEFLGSPEPHQATMSSPIIERTTISRGNGFALANAASTIGDEISQAPSASVSTNTANNRTWVDKLVGSEPQDHHDLNTAFQDHISPTPPTQHLPKSFPSKEQEADNDTSYGLIGSQTALDLVRDLRSYTQKSPTQSSLPRPQLPSILNSPFAPQADEEISRPTTAKRATPTHSRQTSQNALPSQQHHYPHEYSIDSSISSMVTPSQTQTHQQIFQPRGNPGTTHQAALGRAFAHFDNPANNNKDNDSTAHFFDSSNVFQGSSWVTSEMRQSGVVGFKGLEAGFRGDVQTPPNGQGGAG